MDLREKGKWEKKQAINFHWILTLITKCNTSSLYHTVSCIDIHTCWYIDCTFPKSHLCQMVFWTHTYIYYWSHSVFSFVYFSKKVPVFLIYSSLPCFSAYAAVAGSRAARGQCEMGSSLHLEFQSKNKLSCKLSKNSRLPSTACRSRCSWKQL